MLWVVVCAVTNAHAQATGRTIGGAVVDATTNAPIARATIKVVQTELSAQTDSDGLFTIAGAPAGALSLEVTAPDHQATTLAISSDRSIVRVVLAPAVAAPASPNTREIRGRIVDAAGDGIAGASVTVVGTQLTALTDDKGAFSLEGVAPTDVRLRIEAGGYRDRTIKALADVEDVSAMLELAAGEQVFIEGRAPVIVKQNLANGASVINSEDLNRVSAQTLDAAMQGKISGANLQSDSGAPGGGAQLRLRGISTINGQSSPLYVIDGVIVSNVEIGSGLNAITQSAGGTGPTNQDIVVNRISDSVLFLEQTAAALGLPAPRIPVAH